MINLHPKSYNFLSLARIGLGSLCVLFVLATVQGQERCGNDAHLLYVQEQYPHIKPVTQATTTENISSRASVSIPVVFHILFRQGEDTISDDRIYEQLAQLNRSFAGFFARGHSVHAAYKDRVATVDVQFCLADTDPEGTPTNGIIRKKTIYDNLALNRDPEGRLRLYYDDVGGSDAWDIERYLNIWIIEMNGFFGFANIPSLHGIVPHEDGVVMAKNAIAGAEDSAWSEGRILSHEVGHYLDLWHLWGAEVEECEEDDLVSDTPVQSIPFLNCDYANQYDCQDIVMTENFMGYAAEHCVVMFTHGQRARMLSCLATTRKNLARTLSCKHGADIAIDKWDNILFDNMVNDNLVFTNTNKNVPVEGTMTIIDVSGRVLATSSVTILDKYTLNVGFLTPGLYYIQLETSMGTAKFRTFVKFNN